MLGLFNQNKTTSDRQRYGSAGLFQIGGFFSLCSIYLHYQTTKIHMCWCVVAGHFHCKKIYSGRLKQGFSQLLLTANSYFDPCKIKSTFLNCKKSHNAQCSDHFHHHVASFSHQAIYIYQVSFLQEYTENMQKIMQKTFYTAHFV